MMLKIFKIRKPKRFELRTRYYDAGKEAFEVRYKNSINAGNDVYTRMKIQFRERRRTQHKTSPQGMRIILIAALLILITWYLFF
jgi:hypothetical protein